MIALNDLPGKSSLTVLANISVPQFLIDAGYFTLVTLEVTEVGKVVIENKKYKGKICGFVPAFLYSDKEIIILFDTKEYGVLKVNDKYPIILNPKSEYEDEDDE